MSDAPSITERYTTARQTSDLSVSPLTSRSPADVLIASGWAAQENEAALLLWEVIYRGKSEPKNRLAGILGSQLNARMAKDRKLKGDAWVIAREVLAWYLHGVCQPCGGLGYEKIPGTPTLSDRLCPACNGAKRVALPQDSASHTWMANYIESLTAIAAGQVMKRLASDMNL